MTEFAPIPITLKRVDPRADLEPNVHPESRMESNRQEMRAVAERACALANSAEFQQHVPIAAWNSMKSSEGKDREMISAWLGAKDDFLTWLKDFPDATGTSESERLMACFAVLEAMGEGEMA